MHPEVIVADELTNGMHHAMIGQCIDLIGERQAFLATQNPLLLDNLPGFTSAEQVQSTFILCTTERENDRERMVWRNMTAEEVKNIVMLAAQPTKEFVKVEQVAGLALFLTTPAADEINGAALNIDGGWTAQ